MSNPARAASAMVLCAGLGTRLRPLTEWCAKPLVPVGDRPAVAHVIERLASFPVRVVNVHHRPDELESWARSRGIAVSREVDLLGTAGGLAHARALLGEGAVLVWNGDILCDLDPMKLLEEHAADATLAVAPRARGQGAGNVGLDDEGRIVRLRRQSFGDETRSADFIGIHVVGAALRETLPASGCLVGDVYLPALARGARLVARVVDVPFSDIGSLGEYVAANRAWLARRGASEWRADDAEVNASIDGSIIGAGARIDAPAHRCIVWPGAHVREPTDDAIVTPHGRVAYAAAR
jgi:mannose-1-phosphate guanylyltransferase